MTILTGLNRPWIHFIVLGTVLFWLQGKLFPQPLPVIGPISSARADALQQQWMATVGRPPDTAQMARMIDAELDRDMLFQQALAMQLHLYDTVVYQRLVRNMKFLQLGEGKSDQELYEQALELRLHLGDEVVKRRLIQVMEQLLLAANPPAEPSEEDLKAEFAARKEELRRPPRYSIEHIYFNRERESEAPAVVARITEQGLNVEQALELSSPFLPGYRFVEQSPDQLARNFGVEFVSNLEKAGPQAGEWLGPIRSTYGLHYVFVSAVEPGRDATLEEVRPQLMRDLQSRGRSAALQESIARLRTQYEVRK